jgi:hypothetical protein
MKRMKDGRDLKGKIKQRKIPKNDYKLIGKKNLQVSDF